VGFGAATAAAAAPFVPLSGLEGGGAKGGGAKGAAQGAVAATTTADLAADFAAADLPDDLRLALRKLSKKDPVTKLKVGIFQNNILLRKKKKEDINV